MWIQRLSLVLVLLAAIPDVIPESRAQTFATEAGYVEFKSRVPLHNFTGKSDLLVGMINLADSTVDFYVDLESLKTGIGKRDKDMRKSLNVEDYPFAEFFGKLTTAYASVLTGPQQVSVVGTFKLNGISRPVQVDGILEKKKGGLRLRAEWKLNIEDYGIVPPKLLIMRVHEIQEIKIDALLLPTSN